MNGCFELPEFRSLKLVTNKNIAAFMLFGYLRGVYFELYCIILKRRIFD